MVLSRRRFVGVVAAAAALATAGIEAVLAAAGRWQTSSEAPPAQSQQPGPASPGPSRQPAPGIYTSNRGDIVAGPPAGPNRVARENLVRGTRHWEIGLEGQGDAEGYPSDVSAGEGDEVRLHLRSNVDRVTVTAYRLGWYDGAGARPLASWEDVRVAAQPDPASDPITGEVRCEWDPAVSFRVPADWVSGIYLFLLEPRGGSPQYVPLVIRESAGVAPILVLSSSATFHAYNAWGGKSLYPDESTGAPTISGGTQAVRVSFDRPFNNYRGGGRLMRWEPQFVRWLESEGYDVAYASDLDLERHPELVQDRRLLVFQGHPEYWSVPMRATVEAAIAAGTNVVWFSANEVYWRVRFEDNGAGLYRSVTCYRYAKIDPLTGSDPVHTTTKWREAPSPVPESRVIGQMYGHQVLAPTDFVCTAPDHWIYAGTGMKSGDSLANLVGQEYDRVFTDQGSSPAELTVLATSPVLPNFGHLPSIYGPVPPNEPSPPVHNATIYSAPSGATVVSIGTMQWSWALDSWGDQCFEGIHTPVDERAKRITHNILDRLGR